MHRGRMCLIVAVLGTMAIWGCGQSPGERAAIAQRDARLKKLHDDLVTMTELRDELNTDLDIARMDIVMLREEIEALKAVVQERDALREELAARTAEREALSEELMTRTAEREALVEELAERTTERDAGFAHIDELRSGLKSLLDRAEAALPVSPKAVTAVEPEMEERG